MKLTSLDLNLLVAFKVLIEERHVSRAGERISLSQPAMSNALARLRQLFNDELLVRTPHGMQPTAKALALAGPVCAALDQLERSLDEGGQFDPAQTHRTFTLAMADQTSLVVLPAIKRALMRDAPELRLVVLSSARGQGLAMVDRGEADLAIGLLPEPAPHLRSRPLFHDRLVCMARPDHPAFRSLLTLEAYLALAHVKVQAVNTTNAVDRMLETLGVKRRVEVVLPHHLVVPPLLVQTDLVATESERLALNFRPLVPLALQSPPFETPPIEISMAWHSRLDRDPAHRWLRERIPELIDDHRPHE